MVGVGAMPAHGSTEENGSVEGVMVVLWANQIGNEIAR